MYPEIVITVGATHWRCIRCKLLNKRVVSIDEHINSKHADVHQGQHRKTCPENQASLENNSYSDSEIETRFIHTGTTVFVKNWHAKDSLEYPKIQTEKHIHVEPVKSTYLSKSKQAETLLAIRTETSARSEVKNGVKRPHQDQHGKTKSARLDPNPQHGSMKIPQERLSQKAKVRKNQSKFQKQRKTRAAVGSITEESTADETVHHLPSANSKLDTYTARLVSCTSNVKKGSSDSFQCSIEEGDVKAQPHKSGNDAQSSQEKESQPLEGLDSSDLRNGKIHRKQTQKVSENMVGTKPCVDNETKRKQSKSAKELLAVSSGECGDVYVRKHRPGRKGTKRKDLVDGEQKIIEETYIGYAEDESGLVDHVNLAFRKAQFAPKENNDVAKDVHTTAETESLVKNLQLLSSLASPGAQEESEHSRHDTYLDNTVHTNSFDFRSCANIVPMETFTPNSRQLDACGSQTELAGSSFSAEHDCTEGHFTERNFQEVVHTDNNSEAVAFSADMLSVMTGTQQKADGDENCTASNLAQKPFVYGLAQSADTEELSARKDTDTNRDRGWVKTTNFSFDNVKVKPPAVVLDAPNISSCHICQAKFSCPEKLSAHVAKMAVFGVAQCRVCKQNFHGTHFLNLHVFGEHETRKKGFCFKCGTVCESMEQLERHVFTHMQDRPLELTKMKYHACRICNKEILSEYSTMQSHYYARHKASLCFDCYIKSDIVYFTDSTAAKEHKQSHEMVCCLCSEKFTSTEQLHAHYFAHTNAHNMQYEEDGEGRTCEKCHQWCPNRVLAMLHDKLHKLQQHRERRAQNALAGFACLQCTKVYRSKRNLDRHHTHAHSQNRTYKFHCEFCGKGADQKTRLQDHIALHHHNIKRYACEYCDQRFVCRPTLRRHVLQEHARDKQYKCEFCGERFCDKVKLGRHLFIHTGMARFMCEHCGKGFHTSSEFNNHMTVHALTRDFVCQGCGQDYKRKEHLRRHVKNCRQAAQTL